MFLDYTSPGTSNESTTTYFGLAGFGRKVCPDPPVVAPKGALIHGYFSCSKPKFASASFKDTFFNSFSI